MPAPPLERLVLAQLAALGRRPAPLEWPEAKSLLHRVEIHRRQLHLVIIHEAVADPHEPASATIARLTPRLGEGVKLLQEARGRLLLVVSVRAVFRGGRNSLALPPGVPAAKPVQRDVVLTRTLRTVHRALQRANASPLVALDGLAGAAAIADSEIRKLAPLGFLAPDLQRALLEGRGPKGADLETLLRRAVGMGRSARDGSLRAYPPRRGNSLHRLNCFPVILQALRRSDLRKLRIGLRFFQIN